MPDEPVERVIRTLAGDPAEPSAAGRVRARARLEAEVARGPRRRRWPVRMSSLLGLTSLVVLTVATATGVFDHRPELSLGVTCFEQPRLEGNEAHLPTTTAAPVTACATLWRRGAMTEGRPVRPPRLTACQSREGRVAVLPLPRGTTCRALDLAILPADYARQARRYASLHEALVLRLAEDDCVRLPRARTIARQELRRQGLGGWTVAVGTRFTAQRPCAAPDVDLKRRRVRLLAVESAAQEPYLRERRQP